MKKDNELIIITDGKEETASILFTFDEADKHYVVFEFDASKEVSAARFEPDGDGIGKLFDIENDSEWNLVEKIYDQYERDLEDESND